MRTHRPGPLSFLSAGLLAVVASLTGCADAPITPDQLQENGELRQGVEAAFSTQERAVSQAVQVSAVLSADPSPTAGDATEFSSEVGTVHLHLMADGLLTERPVIYRWTHGETSVTVSGTLSPSEALRLGSSFVVEPDQVGLWTVEVLEQPEHPGAVPRVLVERQFHVKRPSV